MVVQDYFAIPPEINSALLSTGPGIGSLLSTGGAWHMLSAEYFSAAIELRAVVSTVRGGAWDGPSADRYADANHAYVMWLEHAAADAEALAQSHFEAASAFAVAVTTTPTLAELAANHGMHAALLGTNILGINAIPLAMNEADYIRMWLQAAEAMTVYELSTAVALQDLPKTPTAPQIVAGELLATFPCRSGEAAVSGQALERSESTFNILVDIVRSLTGPLEVLSRELATIDVGDLVRLLMTDPAAAAAALSSLGTALLAYAIWQTTIASIVWGSMLLGPALAIPLATTLGDPKGAEPEEESVPTGADPTPSKPVRVGVESRLPTSSLGPGAMPGPSSSAPTPSANAQSTVVGSGSTPAGPTATLYAYGMRPEDPGDGPGHRPRVRDEEQVAVHEAREASAPAPAAPPQLRERRRRRRSQNKDRSEVMAPETIEVRPEQSRHQGLTPRGRCGAPKDGPSGMQPLLPATWDR